VEQYFNVYSPALAIGVTVVLGQPLATYEWRVIAPRPPAHPQAAELSLGVALRVFRLLAGDDFLPTSVQLRHEPLADPTQYTEYFGCPVEFATSAYGFRFPSSVLVRPLGSDSAMHAVAREYLATLAAPHGTTEIGAVVRLVRRMLPTGALDLALVAEQLAQHPRTVQRHLAARGTSFAGVVDQVRRDEAERYLRDTDMPLTQLAGVLGFSEQSVLSRACRRWFDTSPSQVRRDLRGARVLA
jgi:AraC-like DNA-binding protein